MTQVINLLAVREPDTQAAGKSIGRGFGPKPMSENGLSLSASAAAQLLRAQQVESVRVLKALTPVPDCFAPEFDAARESLETAYKRDDIPALDALAVEYLEKYPVVPLFRKSDLEQASYRFTSRGNARITPHDVAAVWNSASKEEVETYLKTAQSRVDRKSITLYAAAAQKNLGAYDHNLATDLRAELVLSLIAAARLQSGHEGWEKFPIRIIQGAIGLPIEIDRWLLNLDPCGNQKPESESNLLQRYFHVIGKKVRRKDQQEECAKALAAGHETGDLGECECNCEQCCIEPDPCCGEVNYYIADVLQLREQTIRYKASDLAYIENVAPGEKRWRTHSFNKSIEVLSEEETTENHSKERDHQVTERFSLQTEMQKQIAQSLDVDAKVTYGSESSPYSASLSTALGLSKDASNREARQKFREMVSKATETIQSESRKLRSRRESTELTENNKHKFNNSTSLPFVAKYFHVSQEKCGQVFSHGKRLMVDLLIPSPAALYRKLEEKKAEKSKPQPPKTIEQFKLKPSDITVENYQTKGSDHGVDELPSPPTTPPVIYRSVTMERDDPPVMVEVPRGYQATEMNRTGGVVHGTKKRRISLWFGGGQVNIKKGSTLDQATISVSVSEMASTTSASAKKSSNISAKITLEPLEVDLTSWQTEVFSKIREAYLEKKEEYETKLQQYEDELAEWEARQKDKIGSRHPFAAQELMRTFVKRAAIWTMCDHFDDIEVMEMLTPDCGYPEINRPAAAIATKRWYFFDRAFDWNLAEIKFYDFFRNPQCMWPDTFDPDETNFLFKAFLRAGYCRIQVPAALGMGDDVSVLSRIWRYLGANRRCSAWPQ